MSNTSALVGARLGPYEILSALGAGGMGEVYKARDTRLDRLVAVKVLSPTLAGSADARERFEREAKAISRLSHPNICALFDVGHDADTLYLVMELLDGETLTALIARGPVPLPQVLRIGRAIADALASAHRQGVVHRDLKPGNVLLTSTGVKLLDFGLAKSLEPAGSDHTQPPTAALLTVPGTWLGTAPYMSPEQIDGRAIEGRSDIFALGAVLYEMATGKRAFEGQTSSAIAASVLHRDPPAVSSTIAHVPPAFDRLVRACLEKDPDRRWQSAHDVALQLADIADHPDQVARTSSNNRMQWLGWVAALVAVVGWTLAALRHDDGPIARTELEVALPPDNTFVADVETVRFAVSPDGQRLAFVAYDSAGVRRVWMRDLSLVNSTAVAGTEGASTVFWSPDSRAIAFFVDDTLKRMDLTSGAAVSLCTVQRGIGLTGTWSAEGQILFASIEGQGIYRVSTAGGTPVVEVKPDPERSETRVAFPSFLPDGRRYLYSVKRRDATTTIMLGESGKEAKTVGPLESNAQFVAPATLVFAQGGTLVGQSFDPASGRLSGDPIAIAKSVRYFAGSGLADFSASPSGPVVYQSHNNRSRVAWVDRGGRELGTLGSKGEYYLVRISPRARSALVSRILPSTGSYDIWSLDFELGGETRLTFDDRITEVSGILSRDEQAMYYGVARGGPPNLTRLDFSTGRNEPMLPANLHLQEAQDVSPDGRLLAFSERTEGGFSNFWTMPLQGMGQPSRLRQSTFDEDGLRFSPDGRYFSFASNESGHYEIYIAALAGAAKTRISSNGGMSARWSADGHELFYLSGDNRVMAASVRTTPALEIGTPTPLFSIARRWIDFDVSRDGQRFLALIPEATSSQLPLTAVQHWNRPAR